jgi:cold shock CspA family protein
MIGYVKFFNKTKKFGFVVNESGEYFFHGDAVIGEFPAAGATVDFWLDDGHRGDLVAVDVSVRDDI